MTYTPIHDRVFPSFVFYIAIIIFSVIMTIAMIKKWRERQVKAPLYLSIVFILLTTAILGLTLGLGEVVITQEFRDIYRFSLPFGYALIIVANVFLFMFGIEITSKGKKLLVPLILIGVVMIVIIFLPINWWGWPSEDYAGELNIRLYTTIGVVIYSYIVYIFIASFCNKARKQTDDKVAKAGLKLLMISMLMMILFFVMFILDTLLITLTDHPGYSEFVYVAWIFAICFYIVSYFSLVMPKSLVKRINK